MGLIQIFKHNVSENIHIHHRVKEFGTIGKVIDSRDNLNIFKIKFKDMDGKEQKYWFHRFTGNVVTLPKKKGEWATDVPEENEQKAYRVTNEIVYLWELEPTLDINYKHKDSQENEDKDNESNKNGSISKIH